MFQKNKSFYNDKFLFLFSYLITAIIIFFIGLLLINILDELNVEYINNTFFVSSDLFVAEKSEFITYSVLTVLYPILFFFLFYFFRKINLKKFDVKKIYKIFSIFLIVFFYALFFLTLFNYHLFETLLYPMVKNFILYLVIIIINIRLILNWKKNNAFDSFIKVFLFLIILCISFLYINSNFSQSQYMLHHFEAYFYPIYKINCGLNLLVDFNSLYGNYSYVFSFIMHIFHRDDILFFSIICSFLIFISLLSLYFFSLKTIKNRLICFITMCSVFYTWLSGFIYLQYIPHRVLFPTLILLYIIFYIRKGKKNFFYKFFGFLISSFAIFWNLETGIFVLITWFLFLMYEVLYFNNLKSVKTFKSFFCYFVLFMLSIFLYLCLINFIIFFRTGHFISFSNLFNGISIFFGNGFYMKKMKLFHPWLISVIVYSLALAISIKNIKIFRKNDSDFQNNAIYFVLSIIGMGIFSYYQGRSVDPNFCCILYPAIILSGIFLDNFVSKKEIKSYSLFLIIIMSIYSISFFYLLYDLRFYFIKSELKDNVTVEICSNLYDELVEKNKNIDFIVPFESYYYSYYKIEDKKPFPSYVDLFTYSNIEKIIDYLNQTENNVVISGDIYHIMEEKYSSDFKKIDKRFRIKKLDDDNYYFILRKNN